MVWRSDQVLDFGRIPDTDEAFALRTWSSVRRSSTGKVQTSARITLIRIVPNNSLHFPLRSKDPLDPAEIARLVEEVRSERA